MRTTAPESVTCHGAAPSRQALSEASSSPPAHRWTPIMRPRSSSVPADRISIERQVQVGPPVDHLGHDAFETVVVVGDDEAPGADLSTLSRHRLQGGQAVLDRDASSDEMRPGYGFNLIRSGSSFSWREKTRSWTRMDIQ